MKTGILNIKEDMYNVLENTRRARNPALSIVPHQSVLPWQRRAHHISLCPDSLCAFGDREEQNSSNQLCYYT